VASPDRVSSPEATRPGALTKTWALRYVRVSVVGLLVSVASVIAVFGIGRFPMEEISFKLDDGWCDPPTQGIGEHCFGDYSQIHLWAKLGFNAWGRDPNVPSSSYSPTGWMPAMIFERLGTLIGSERAGLLAYLAVALTCLLVPAIWAGLGRPARRLPLTLLLIGVASTPVVITLDRGNSVAFAVPFVLLVAVGLGREDWRLVGVGVIGAALIKPQFALLAIILLAFRRYREFLFTAASTLALTVLGFAFFPGFPANVINWLLILKSYGGGGTSLLAQESANLSLSQAVLTLMDLTGVSAGIGAPGRDAVATWLDAYGAAMSLVLVAVILVLLLAVGSRLPKVWVLALAVFACQYAVSSAHGYYLAAWLAVVALILRDAAGERGEVPWSGSLDRGPDDSRINRFLVVVLAAAMAPIALPDVALGPLADFWHVTGARGIYQNWTGLALAVTCFILIGAAIRAARPGHTPHVEAGMPSAASPARVESSDPQAS
jgi:hypothetical protein